MSRLLRLVAAALWLAACEDSAQQAPAPSSDGGTSATGGMCEPLSIEPCYSGPPGTAGRGDCVEGIRACTADGLLGPCSAEITPRHDDCGTPSDEDCDGVAPPCPPPAFCSLQIGNLNWAIDPRMAVSPAGDILLSGYFSGSVEIAGTWLVAPRTSASFVARLGPACDHRHSLVFGQGYERVAVAFAPGGDMILFGMFDGPVDLAGATSDPEAYHEVSIARLGPQGQIRWTKAFGSATLGDPAVAVDVSGDIVLAASYTGTVDLGGGAMEASYPDNDIFVAKLHADGDRVFTVELGGDEEQSLHDLELGPTGEIALAGYFQGTFPVGPDTLVSGGYRDVFVAKLDPTGSAMWGRSFGASSEDRAFGVAIDADGSVIASGDFEGTVDIGTGPITAEMSRGLFVVKYDAAGAPLWARALGGAGYGGDGDVHADGQGQILVTGTAGGEIDLGGGPVSTAGQDLFVLRLDGSGAAVAGQIVGDSYDQRGLQIRTDATGAVVVAGEFGGVLDFGQGPLSNNGESDVFLARLAP